MNSTITQALQGLYKKMTGNTANGKTKVQVLNEISASMGATKNSYTTAKCINDITDNYTPGGGGGGDFTTANVTINAIGFSGQVQISHTEDFGMSSSVYIESGQSASVTAVLYKGICESWSADGDATEVSGDATIDDGMAYISGDCTITFGE